jgi:hypothetical protein
MHRPEAQAQKIEAKRFACEFVGGTVVQPCPKQIALQHGNRRQ